MPKLNLIPYTSSPISDIPTTSSANVIPNARAAVSCTLESITTYESILLPQGGIYWNSLPDGYTLIRGNRSELYMQKGESIKKLNIPQGISLSIYEGVILPDGGVPLCIKNPDENGYYSTTQVLINEEGNIRGLFTNQSGQVVCVYTHAVKKEDNPQSSYYNTWSSYPIMTYCLDEVRKDDYTPGSNLSYWLKEPSGHIYQDIRMYQGQEPESIHVIESESGKYIQLKNHQTTNGLYMKISSRDDCLLRDPSEKKMRRTQYYAQIAPGIFESFRSDKFDHEKSQNPCPSLSLVNENGLLEDIHYPIFYNKTGVMYIWNGETMTLVQDFIENIYTPNITKHGRKIVIGNKEYLGFSAKETGHRPYNDISLYEQETINVNGKPIPTWVSTMYSFPAEVLQDDGTILPLTLSDIQTVGGKPIHLRSRNLIPLDNGCFDISSFDQDSILTCLPAGYRHGGGKNAHVMKLLDNEGNIIFDFTNKDTSDWSYLLTVTPIPEQKRKFLWINSLDECGFIHGLFFGNSEWAEKTLHTGKKSDYVPTNWQTGEVLAYQDGDTKYIIRAYDIIDTPKFSLYMLQESRDSSSVKINPNLIDPNLLESILSFYKQHGLKHEGDLLTEHTQLLRS